jgi:hypothetical protein
MSPARRSGNLLELMQKWLPNWETQVTLYFLTSLLLDCLDYLSKLHGDRKMLEA